MDRKQLEKLLGHPLFIVIFTCFCLLSIFSLRESGKKALVSRESIQKLEKSTELVEKEVDKEKEKLDEKQEALTLEKIMRNELLQKKEGEIILQIPDKEDLNYRFSDNATTKQNEPLNEWKKLFISLE